MAFLNGIICNEHFSILSYADNSWFFKSSFKDKLVRIEEAANLLKKVHNCPFHQSIHIQVDDQKEQVIADCCFVFFPRYFLPAMKDDVSDDNSLLITPALVNQLLIEPPYTDL